MKPRRRRVLIFILFYYHYCFFTTNVLGEQRFLEPPPAEKWVEWNSTFVIPCKIIDRKGDCFWEKNGTSFMVSPIADPNQYYEYTDPRHCSLLVKDFNEFEKRNETFRCQVKEVVDKKSKEKALVSNYTRVMIGVKPEPIQIQMQGNVMKDQVHLSERSSYGFECVSRNGLPAARIQWLMKINNTENETYNSAISSVYHEEKNVFSVTGKLEYTAHKKDFGKYLVCKSCHPITNCEEKVIKLIIEFAPEITMRTNATFVDAMDHVVECRVTSYPPVSEITWLKIKGKNQENITSVSKNYQILTTEPKHNESSRISRLLLPRVNKTDQKTIYQCQTKYANKPYTKSIALEVKYGPVPAKVTTSKSYQTVEYGSKNFYIECPICEANPPSNYKLIRIFPNDTRTSDFNGSTSSIGNKILFPTFDWSSSGKYQCLAYNFVNEVPCGDTYLLEAYSRPWSTKKGKQINEKGKLAFHGSLGHSIGLDYEFCCQPPPKDIIWQWGSNKGIRNGESFNSKYRVDKYKNISPHCYVTTLEIENLKIIDSREYRVKVINEHGILDETVELTVSESLGVTNMATAFIVGFMILLITVVLITRAVYLRRKRRDKKIQLSKVEELKHFNNGKTNIPFNDDGVPNGMNGEKNFAFKMDYNDVKQERVIGSLSPEAMEVRRAPVVLQSATLV